MLSILSLLFCVNWYTPNIGLPLAKSTHKPFLIYYHTSWCGYCKTMDRTVFNDTNLNIDSLVPIALDCGSDDNFFFQVLLEIRQDGDSVESNRQTVGAIKEIHPFGNADLKTLSWHKCLLFQSLALHMLLPEDKKDIRELNLNMLKSRLLIS